MFCYCGIQGLNLASSPEFEATVIYLRVSADVGIGKVIFPLFS